jgi:hypothetical protein
MPALRRMSAGRSRCGTGCVDVRVGRLERRVVGVRAAIEARWPPADPPATTISDGSAPRAAACISAHAITAFAPISEFGNRLPHAGGSWR